MFISQISIRRDGYYAYGGSKPDASKPFLATIEVHGGGHKTELNLSPEMSERIVAIVADEVAAAGRATAEAMVAEAMTITALPAPKGKGK
jgi:hypothetical protein